MANETVFDSFGLAAEDYDRLSDETLDKIAAGGNPYESMNDAELQYFADGNSVANRNKPRVFDPNYVGRAENPITAGDAKTMPAMGGTTLASLQAQAESGTVANEDDGTLGNWFGNLVNVVGHNSSGGVVEKNMSKFNQMILRGTVNRDGKEVPLTSLDDDELDYLTDSAGWNGSGSYFRSFLGKWARPDSGIMKDWDRTEGARISDPVARKAARVRYAQDIARANIEHQESMKQAAQTEIDNRQRQTGAGIIAGGEKMGAYMLPYMIPGAHGVVAGLVEGAGRANELMNDRLDTAEDGTIRVGAERDTSRAAIAKGVARGIIAPLIETVGGEAAAGVLGGIAKGTLGRIPLVSSAGGKLAETAAGKAVSGWMRSMRNFGKYTGIQGFPVEVIEELEDQVVDSALALDRRESERDGTMLSRAGESAKQFFKPESLMDLAESMLLVQVLGGGVAALNDRTRSKAIDNILARDVGVEKEKLKGYTPDEKWAAYETYINRLSPEQVAKKFDAGRKAIDELTRVMGVSDAELKEFERAAGFDRYGNPVAPTSTADADMAAANAARANDMLTPEQAQTQQKAINDANERYRATLNSIARAEAVTEDQTVASDRGGIDAAEELRRLADTAVEQNRDEYDKWLADTDQEDSPTARADWFGRTSDKSAQERVQTVPGTEDNFPEPELSEPSPATQINRNPAHITPQTPETAPEAVSTSEKTPTSSAVEQGATSPEGAVQTSATQETRTEAAQSAPSAEVAMTPANVTEGARAVSDASDATQEAQPVDNATQTAYTTPTERTTDNGQPEQQPQPEQPAGAESGVATQDDFSRLQAESRGMSDDERRAFRDGSKKLDDGDLGSPVGGRSENRHGRVVDVLRARVAASNGGAGADSVRPAKTEARADRPAEVFNIGKVDPKTFHDVFEYVRNYLKNGELVDLHDSYDGIDCYLSEDGLCGFAVEPNGNLISVFSLRPGSLYAMSGAILRAGAKKLDAYASKEQDLRTIYEKKLGFKPAADMDFNPAYDPNDIIGTKHGNPKVTFMILPEAGNTVETRSFGMNDYDEATKWQMKQLSAPPKLLKQQGRTLKQRMYEDWLYAGGNQIAKKDTPITELEDTPENKKKFEAWLKQDRIERKNRYEALTEQRISLREEGEDPAYINWLTERGLVHNPVVKEDWLKFYKPRLEGGVAAETPKEKPKTNKLRTANGMAPSVLRQYHEWLISAGPEAEDGTPTELPDTPDNQKRFLAERNAVAEENAPLTEEEKASLRKEGEETTVSPEEAKTLKSDVESILKVARVVYDVNRDGNEGDAQYRADIRSAVETMTDEERLQFAKLLNAQLDARNSKSRKKESVAVERRTGWEDKHNMLLGRIKRPSGLDEMVNQELAKEAEIEARKAEAEVKRLEAEARKAEAEARKAEAEAQQVQPPRLRTAAEAEAENSSQAVASDATPVASPVASKAVPRITPDPVRNDALAKFMPEASRGDATFREEPMMGGASVFVGGKNTGVFVGNDGKFFIPNRQGKFESFDKAQAFLNREAMNFRRGDTIDYVAEDGKTYRGKANVTPDGRLSIVANREVGADGKSVAMQPRTIEIPDDKRGNVTLKMRNMFSLAFDTIPETWDEKVKAEVQKAAEHVKGWLKGVKVKFAERPDEDAEYRPLRDGDGNVVGSYDRSTNEVTLFPGASVKTVAHEIGWHAMHKFAEDEAAAGRRQLLDTLDGFADNAPQVIKDAVRSGYSDFDETALRDEIGAHLFERKHGEAFANALRTMEGRAWYSRAWDAIKRVAKDFLKAFGVDVNRVDLAKLNRMSPEQGVAWLTEQMLKGKTLGGFDGDDGGGGGGSRKSLFFGEKGVSEFDRLQSSMSADGANATDIRKNTDIAKEMIGDRKWSDLSRDEKLKIKLATGLEVGADGKWRYEFPDEFMIGENVDLTETRSVSLPRVIGADRALFQFYPQLRKAEVTVVRDPKNQHGAYTTTYRRGSDGSAIPVPTITIHAGNDAASNRRLLVHELQHAVQSIEGFADGGPFDAKASYAKVKWNQEIKNSGGYDDAYGRSVAKVVELGFEDRWVKRLKEIRKGLGSIVEGLRMGSASAFGEVVRRAGVYDAVDYSTADKIKFLDDVISALRKSRSGFSAYNGPNKYNSLAGEVEAYNAMRRSSDDVMTKTAEETEDVPRGEQIVIGASEGGTSDAAGSNVRLSRNINIPQTNNGLMDKERTRGSRLRERWQDSDIEIRNVQNEIGGVEEKVDANGHTDAKTEFERDADGNVIYEDVIKLDEDGNEMHYKNGNPVIIGKRPKRRVSLGSTDVYAAKMHANGYVQEGLNDIQDRRDELSRALVDGGIKPKELDTFLTAMHAEERNRTASDRDGRVYDPTSKFGSGMSEVEAKNFLAKRETVARRAAFDKAAKIVWDMNRADLDRRLASGRISREQYDLLTDQWKYYIPLRTDSENTTLNAFNMSTAGFRANEFAMAKGRESEAASPTAFSFLQAEQGVNGSERNVVYQTLANLVRHAEDEGKPIGEIVEGEVEPTGTGWTFRFSDGKRVVADGASKLAANHDNIVLFKEDGVLKAIRIDPGKEGRGVDFAKAVTGENIGKWGEGLQWIPTITRKMSEWRTQFVPTFIVRNGLADMLESWQALIGRYGVKDGLSLAKDAVKAEFREFGNLKAYLKTGALNGRVKEFVESGTLIKGGVAAMGFAGETKETQDTYEKYLRLKKGFAGMNNAERLKSAAAYLKDLVTFCNEMVENETRLGLFCALRDKGVPINEASRFAREATVDFNRKGTAMPWFNGLYMFANAAMQGTARAGRAFVEDWKGDIPASGLGSKRRHGELTMTLAALGVAQAVINHFFGDDDEREEAGGRNASNLTEYEKKHHLGVPVPGGHQITLLRTRGPYASIPYVAQTLASVALGDTDAVEAAKRIGVEGLSQVTDVVGGSGVGSKSTILQTLMPSAIDPFVQWATGTDYKGDERVRRSFSKTAPASWNGKDSTSSAFKATAQFINAITGGNENRKGFLDWAPEDIQLAWDTAFGGVARDISTTFEGVENAVRRFSGEETEKSVVGALPFFRDVFRDYPENTSRFYDALEKYEADKDEFRKTADIKRRAELKREHPYLSQGKGRIDNLKDRIDDLRHWEKDEVKNGNKWVKRKQPISAERRADFHARRLRLQATVLRILGE